MNLFLILRNPNSSSYYVQITALRIWAA